MTRQAISPRFAIRIRLNMCLFTCDLWRGPAWRAKTTIWHAEADVTIPSYSKINLRQRSIPTLQADFRSQRCRWPYLRREGIEHKREFPYETKAAGLCRPTAAPSM